MALKVKGTGDRFPAPKLAEEFMLQGKAQMAGVDAKLLEDLADAITTCGREAGNPQMLTDFWDIAWGPLSAMLRGMNRDNRENSVRFLTHLFDTYAYTTNSDTEFGLRANMVPIIAKEVGEYHAAREEITPAHRKPPHLMDLVVRLGLLYAANGTSKVGGELGRRITFLDLKTGTL